MKRTFLSLLFLPLLLTSSPSYAQIKYGPAIVGPDFREQPWLGQPGYDNPGPAPQYRPKERVVYGPGPKKEQPKDEQKPAANAPNTPQTNTQPQGQQQGQPQGQTQGQQGQQQQQSQQQNQDQIKTVEQVQRQSTQTPTGYRFGRLRNAPTFQPGNAQMYDEKTIGQRPQTNFNVQRYQQIPRHLRSNPSWQSGHFISAPPPQQQQQQTGNQQQQTTGNQQ